MIIDDNDIINYEIVIQIFFYQTSLLFEIIGVSNVFRCDGYSTLDADAATVITIDDDVFESSNVDTVFLFFLTRVGVNVLLLIPVFAFYE
jgi:hypothetical protein